MSTKYIVFSIVIIVIIACFLLNAFTVNYHYVESQEEQKVSEISSFIC